MLHAKIDKPLIAVHISLWLPLLGLILFAKLGPEKGGGALQYLPLAIIPIGWLLTPIFTLWSLLRALRTFAPGRFDPQVLRIVTWHKLAMLPVFTINNILVHNPIGASKPCDKNEVIFSFKYIDPPNTLGYHNKNSKWYKPQKSHSHPNCIGSIRKDNHPDKSC